MAQRCWKLFEINYLVVFIKVLPTSQTCSYSSDSVLMSNFRGKIYSFFIYIENVGEIISSFSFIISIICFTNLDQGSQIMNQNSLKKNKNLPHNLSLFLLPLIY